MARIVLTNAYITINGVNLSDHIGSVTLTTTDDVIETTAFGTSARTRIGGLADNSVALEFHQDYAANSVEATINAAGSSLVGTVTAIVVKPNGATTGADNPAYSFNALVSEWTPLNGAVGELATASVTWPIDGNITKAAAAILPYFLSPPAKPLASLSACARLRPNWSTSASKLSLSVLTSAIVVIPLFYYSAIDSIFPTAC